MRELVGSNPKSLHGPTIGAGEDRSTSSIQEHSEDLYSQESGKAEFEKYASVLRHLGLVRSVVTSKGTGYEPTESDSSSAKEPHNVELDSNPSHKIDIGKIYVSLAKDQVTVVIPTLNEAEGITKVLEEVQNEGYRNVLVVEGYSNDKTVDKAEQNGVRVIYQHGPGKAGAVSTAIEQVQTPYMLFMDGDHTYDPKDIWRLLNQAEHYSHVIGARDKRHIPTLHRLGNWVISQVFGLLFGMKVSDVCSGMYLLDTEEAKKNKLREPGFNAEIELAAISASNESLTEVPITYRPRVGRGKLTAWDGFGILAAAFTLASRYNPVLLYSGLAVLSIIPGTVILGWSALQWFASGIWHSGWVVLGVGLVLVAAQAFTLATVSILTKHSEERLLHELRRAKTTS